MVNGEHIVSVCPEPNCRGLPFSSIFNCAALNIWFRAVELASFNAGTNSKALHFCASQMCLVSARPISRAFTLMPYAGMRIRVFDILDFWSGRECMGGQLMAIDPVKPASKQAQKELKKGCSRKVS